MSDAELSDIADDEDLVRRHEFSDGEADAPGDNDDGEVNVSGEEVKDGDGDGDANQGKRVDPSKPKVTRKLFVLNTERLKGPKGVHTIEKLFEGFKFKGKGHEKEDLDKVMKRLEYWAFRLFPKLDFDDILQKCEHLGHKKDLQVHLKKYRMGMISADDPVRDENEMIQEEDDEQEDESAVINMERQPTQSINDDEFDRLMAENVDAVEQAAMQTQI